MAPLNHLQLNANVAYVAECLASAQAHLTAQKAGCSLRDLGQADDASLYSQYFGMISRSISGCLQASGNEKAAKFQIFAFLLAKHFRSAEISSSVDISLELILDLAIWHQFSAELFEVTGCLLSEQEETELFGSFSSHFERPSSVVSASQRFVFSFACLQHFIKNNWNEPAHFRYSVFAQMLKHVTDKEPAAAAALKVDQVNLIFNDLLSLCCESLSLSKPLELAKEARQIELRTGELWKDPKVSSRILVAVKLTASLTEDFSLSPPLVNWKAAPCLTNILYLLSLLRFESAILDPEDLVVVNRFCSFLAAQIETAYQIVVDDHLVMRHRLYGFEKLFHSLVVSPAKTRFGSKDFQVMKCLSECLASASSLYSLLRSLDQSRKKGGESPSCSKLKTLFWKSFDELALDQKIQLIGLIYGDESNDLKISAATAASQQHQVLECLYDKCFASESTLIINQLNAENCQDAKMLSKIARLMCMSLSMFTEKLVFYGLGNRNQLPTFLNVFNTFSAILATNKANFSHRQSVLIRSLSKSFKSTLHTKSDKSLQNLANFLKMLIKPNKVDNNCELPPIISANEFYRQVLEDHFRVDGHQESVESLAFVLELYEILLKQQQQFDVDVTHLAFFLATASWLNFCELSKSNQHATLGLKDKCMALARQLVKRFTYSSSSDAAKQSGAYEWLFKLTAHMDWPYSSLTMRLTKRLLLPSCLQTVSELSFVSDSSIRIQYNSVEMDPLSALLELGAVNRDLKSKVSTIVSFPLVPDEMTRHVLEVLHDNRSPGEYANLFSLILHLIESNEIAFQVNAEVLNSLGGQAVSSDSARLLAFFRFHSLLTTLIEASCTEFSMETLLTSSRSFIKETSQSFEDERSRLHSLLVSVYYSEKLAIWDAIAPHSQDQMHFTIELSSLALKVAEQLSSEPKDGSHSQVVVDSLLQLCAKHFGELEEKNQNYKYLLDQNFIRLKAIFSKNNNNNN